MKKSNVTKIGIAVTGALLLGWIVLEMMSSGPTKVGASKPVDETVCPDCGAKLPKPGGDCLECIGNMGQEAYRAKKEKARGGNGAIVLYVLVSLLVVLIAVHIGFVVHGRKGKTKEEILFYYWCGKCGRKLRYRESQIGKASQCPICKRPFMFPKPAEQPKEPFFRALSGRLRRLFSLRTPEE